MHAKDLPESALLIATDSAGMTEFALRPILGKGDYYHVDIVIEAPRSGRLLLKKPIPTSVSLPDQLWPEKAAREIRKFTREARYDPPNPPRPSYVKGWEIRTLVIDGDPAVLIWSAWVG